MGSSAVIHTTGPAAVLSYLMAGALIVLVMRMLGEMAVANPQVGSFAEYARRSLGGWAAVSPPGGRSSGLWCSPGLR